MRIFELIRRMVLGTLVFMSMTAMAQSNTSIPDELLWIADQQLGIEQEKNQIMGQFQVASKACWKKFNVNDCLTDARRQKYQSLAPLEKRTLELNVRHRELKEAERQLRLSDKSATKGSS
jgi:hypothetical protein